MTEQQREMMEKLQKMSPEELKEFQKKQCIFCQIMSGKIPAKKVYEDEKVCAVLDINPANRGHVLLMPREHHAIMPQISDEEIKHLGIITKKLSHAVLKALKSEGTTIFIANGAAAGQRAQHFMIHIIPREAHDGFPTIPQHQMSNSDVSAMREKIQKTINKMLGIEHKKQDKHNKEEKHNKQESHHTKDSHTDDAHENHEEQHVEHKEHHDDHKHNEKHKQDHEVKTKQKKQAPKKSKPETKPKEQSDVSLDDIASLFK